MEIRAAAARSAGAARRNGAGILPRDEHVGRGHNWSRDVQRDAGAGGAVFQQDSVLLLRRTAAECARDG